MRPGNSRDTVDLDGDPPSEIMEKQGIASYSGALRTGSVAFEATFIWGNNDPLA